MNSITKSLTKTKKMKKYLLFLSLTTFCICVFLMQGCNIQDDLDSLNSDVPVTKADMVVASRSYASFSKAVEAQGRQLVSAYAKLSKADKEKVRNILSQAKQNHHMDAFGEIGEILKYDLKASFEKLEQMYGAVDMDDVSPDDLIRAVCRAKQNKISSRTSTEEKDKEKEKVYYACLETCDTGYTFHIAVCKDEFNKDKNNHTCDKNCYCVLYPGIEHDDNCPCYHKEEDRKFSCEDEASLNRVKCILDCDKQWKD